ncbi:ATP-grasp fold amidoligase family protein [Novosphingobium sp. KN65.2]|uniref:ATP-grasp fold amidoligase family protein n=1 Tax=Novosphingobium sp. KN65.2 TaxID=1478134 RepID=UPI0005E7BFA1|nr:ATP-grasp fold amidoligase family protein [Novosphingobium sp. KN65.2]CDO37141.1 putative Glycosyltransferase [Novosphingobium sp. KN65.2]
MNLRREIEGLCKRHLGRLPDLENPRGYNDKIQWLKLHDQRREQIKACDKWAVREMVPERHLIPAKVGIAPDLVPGFVKCTHDSGSARRVRSEHEAKAALDALFPRLSSPYGVGKGEWAYRFVPPRLITEKALDHATDYKFHCVHGRIEWVQVIWDRGCGTKEAILTPLGRATDLHMDEKMVHAPAAVSHPGETAWRAMSHLATRLAQPWRYVRVDLYWSQGQAWFGELTFWPRAGCYRSKDEAVFGEMLDIDLIEKLEPIVP